MPQFEHVQPVAFKGESGDGRLSHDASYRNQVVAETDTVTWVGTTADGSYAVRIQGEELDEELIFDSGGATSVTAVAAGIVAAAAANENLLNVVSITPSAGVNTLAFLHPDRQYTVTTRIFDSGNGSGTVAETVASGGTRVGLARVVVQGVSDREAALPGGGSVSADAVGITKKNTDAEVNEGDPNLVSGYPAGSMMTVRQMGTLMVDVEDAVAANGNVFFRIAAATGPLEALGKMRSDVDGGDAVQLLGAKYVTSAAAGGLVKVSINTPATA